MSIRALTLALLALAAPGFIQAGAPAAKLVQRGEYLVGIMGCNDCHTPMRMGPKGPEPDFSRRLSGHPEGLKMPAAPTGAVLPWGWSGSLTMTAFAGPWGVSYAANLTSDKETGLGAWTEAQFLKMVKSARHLGAGRPVMPPMPVPSLQAASEEDLKALFAYLQSVPAIRNRVPDLEEAAH